MGCVAFLNFDRSGLVGPAVKWIQRILARLVTRRNIVNPFLRIHGG